DIPDLNWTSGVRWPVGTGEAFQVHPERDSSWPASEPLPPHDATGLVVADLDPSRMPQCPSLQPAERDRIALMEVLGRIEYVWRTVAPESPDREDLRRRERERLLMDVDHVP